MLVRVRVLQQAQRPRRATASTPVLRLLAGMVMTPTNPHTEWICAIPPRQLEKLVAHDGRTEAGGLRSFTMGTA